MEVGKTTEFAPIDAVVKPELHAQPCSCRTEPEEPPDVRVPLDRFAGPDLGLLCRDTSPFCTCLSGVLPSLDLGDFSCVAEVQS